MYYSCGTNTRNRASRLCETQRMSESVITMEDDGLIGGQWLMIQAANNGLSVYIKPMNGAHKHNLLSLPGPQHLQ